MKTEAAKIEAVAVARATTEPCAMGALVEARRDGRLGAREEASLDRHLGVCAPCRAHERELEEIRTLLRCARGAPLTPLEHQRGRLALLRAAAVPPESRSVFRRRRVLVAPLGVVLTVVAVTLGAARPAAVPLARRLPAPSRPSEPLLEAAGSREGAPSEVLDRPASLAVEELEGERSYPRETIVRASPSARFERRSLGPVERVSLHDGTLDLEVRQLDPGERFVVATDDAEVEVRGTVFQVVAHAGRVVHVGVSEGRVEVRHHRSVSFLSSGGEWQPPREASPGEARPKPRGGPGRPPRPPASTPESVSDREASRSFDAAVDLLGRGNYTAAEERLQAFCTAYPSDGRADLAAFLAIVSLQRAGRRAEAQEAARRYLVRYPEGDRRADAVRVASGR